MLQTLGVFQAVRKAAIGCFTNNNIFFVLLKVLSETLMLNGIVTPEQRRLYRNFLHSIDDLKNRIAAASQWGDSTGS